MEGYRLRQQGIGLQMKDRKRIWMAFSGVVFCGVGDGFIKASMFGTDPITGAITGISMISRIGFGNLYVMISLFMFLITLLLDRHYIALITVVNVLGTGYIVQFTSDVLMRGQGGFSFRILYFVIGLVILSVSSSFYFSSEMGVSAYDAMSLIMKDRMKMPMKMCRVGTDLFCVAIAFLCGAPVGIGTVVTAFCLGPFIEYFSRHLANPLLST